MTATSTGPFDAGPVSIHRGVVDLVDDESLDGSAAAFDLEAEAVHHGVNRRLHIVVVRIDGLEMVAHEPVMLVWLRTGRLR